LTLGLTGRYQYVAPLSSKRSKPLMIGCPVAAALRTFPLRSVPTHKNGHDNFAHEN
jgi:hypothetical protein